jgi:hypothetical protein
MRTLAGASILLLVGCGAEEKAPEPIKYPGSEGAKTLVALIDDGGPLRGEVYDLKNSGGTAPDLSLAVIQALYFTDAPADLRMKPGSMTITDKEDPLGKRIPLFDKAFEIRLEGGVGSWTMIDEVEETYFKYRDNALIKGSVKKWGTLDTLDGVEVCAPDVQGVDCVITQGGQFEVEGFEPGSEVTLTLSRGDLLPTAVNLFVETGEVDIAASFYVMDFATLDTLTATIGVTPNRSAGIVDYITFRGIANPISNVDGRLYPESGTTHRHLAGGIAFDVAPGDYQLFLTRPDREFCGPSGTAYNWFGEEPNEVRVKVMAGFVTHVQGLICN